MLATADLRTKTNALGATIFLFSELYGKRIVQLFKSKKESNSKKYFNAFYSKPGLKKNKNKKQSHKGEGCTEKPRIGGEGSPGTVCAVVRGIRPGVACPNTSQPGCRRITAATSKSRKRSNLKTTSLNRENLK